MGTELTVTISAVFVALALWHFHMALKPPAQVSGAVPSVNGKPVFVPSKLSTFVVGIVLLSFAALVAVTGGLLSIGLPRTVAAWLSYGLALGLLARAIGEFKYVGFFKRVRSSRFAELDSLVYSPLCLMLSGGVALVALLNE
ncbi:MAG: DUF3995 domain-containing protein [Ramlibacter sp.]